MVEFRVLRCAHCQTFQVLQVTKSPKWKCKLCGEKQSVLKEYGRGSGADCRCHVQKLNSLRMEMDTNSENNTLNSAYNEQTSSCNMMNDVRGECVINQKKKSHWETFLEKDDSDENEGLETAKDKDDSHFPHDGRNEQKMCVTTDWSTFQNERRQTWKNKRKMHDRSSWKKSAKYEDSKGDICFDDNKTFGNGSSWKQPRIHSSGSVDQDFKGSDSQIKIMSCGDTWSDRSMKYGFSDTGFNSYGNKKVGSSQKYTQHPSHDSNFDSGCDKILKHEIDVPSQGIPALATSVVIKKNNVSNAPRKPVETTTKSSKWSGFMTEKGEDNSDDSSDNEDDNQNSQNVDIVGDSFRVASLEGLDNNSRGNRFIIDNELDDSDGFNENRVNHCVIKKDSNNFLFNENLNPNASKGSSFGSNTFADNSDKSAYLDNSQSIKKGNNIVGVKSVVHSNISSTSNRRCLTQPQGRSIDKKSSLFQIGDDDNDA